MPDWLISFLCVWLSFCNEGDTCRTITFDNERHAVCSFRVDRVSLEMFHEDADGAPFAYLSTLKRSLNRKPLLLMNGGMYHDDLAPVGLYIENGTRKARLSTKGGWGNFHLLPNGVFWIAKDGPAGVSETRSFAKRFGNDGKGLSFATQSGPMLVIDGKLHPRFLVDSDSRKIRNGVGVSGDGNWIYFAQSRGLVTFHHFGRLFRDELDTPNALFLDGTISTMEGGDISLGGWRQLGPIIGVFAQPPDPRTGARSATGTGRSGTE